jgi:hypothetical protein
LIRNWIYFLDNIKLLSWNVSASVNTYLLLAHLKSFNSARKSNSSRFYICLRTLIFSTCPSLFYHLLVLKLRWVNKWSHDNTKWLPRHQSLNLTQQWKLFTVYLKMVCFNSFALEKNVKYTIILRFIPLNWSFVLHVLE